MLQSRLQLFLIKPGVGQTAWNAAATLQLVAGVTGALVAIFHPRGEIMRLVQEDQRAFRHVVKDRTGRQELRPEVRPRGRGAAAQMLKVKSQDRSLGIQLRRFVFSACFVDRAEQRLDLPARSIARAPLPRRPDSDPFHALGRALGHGVEPPHRFNFVAE